MKCAARWCVNPPSPMLFNFVLSREKSISDDLHVDDKDHTTTNTEVPLLHTSEDGNWNEETLCAMKQL